MSEDKPVASVVVVFESETNVDINSLVIKACEEVTTVTTASTTATTPLELGKIQIVCISFFYQN